MSGETPQNARGHRVLRLHAGAWAAAAVVAIVAGLALQDGWRFFWLALVWGFAVFLHYLYVKSGRIDERWAARRAAEVTGKAYDAGHIDIIRERYDADPPAGGDGGSGEDGAAVSDPNGPPLERKRGKPYDR